MLTEVVSDARELTLKAIDETFNDLAEVFKGRTVGAEDATASIQLHGPFEVENSQMNEVRRIAMHGADERIRRGLQLRRKLPVGRVKNHPEAFHLHHCQKRMYFVPTITMLSRKFGLLCMMEPKWFGLRARIRETMPEKREKFEAERF